MLEVKIFLKPVRYTTSVTPVRSQRLPYLSRSTTTTTIIASLYLSIFAYSTSLFHVSAQSPVYTTSPSLHQPFHVSLSFLPPSFNSFSLCPVILISFTSGVSYHLLLASFHFVHSCLLLSLFLFISPCPGFSFA